MKIVLLDSGIGLIPFVDEIIKMNKKNEYYLYMDYKYFPYGEKNKKQLKKRLNYLLKKFEKINPDLLLICCNTLSKVYLDGEFDINYPVKTILELNLKHLNHHKILVTPLLKEMFKNDDRFISTSLASSIENNDIRKIIEDIKNCNFDKKLILGCTHFPLVKKLFSHYKDIEVKSYENEFIAKLRQDKNLSFYVRPYELKIISKYFTNLNISFYSLT